MKYLVGSRKEFFEFLNSIASEDKVAVLTHTDLDGIASAVFLEEILKSRKIKTSVLEFLNYGAGMFGKIESKLKENSVSKIFVLDIQADVNDLAGFENLRNNFDVFLIDHHPQNNELADLRNIIKTETEDCTSLVVYELGKGIIEEKDWFWLVCSAIISDMAFKKKENFEFLKKHYPSTELEKIFKSAPAEISSKISSALVYFSEDLNSVYNLIKKNEIKKFEELDKIIREEISFWSKKFHEKAEFYSRQNLYFFKFNPKFDILSNVMTIVSNENPDAIYVGVSPAREKNKLKISARCQSKKFDMAVFIKKGIEGLTDAVGGGHIPAAGGSILKKDLKKFKENILKD